MSNQVMFDSVATTVLQLILYPCDVSRKGIWWAVVSSSSRILRSTNAFTASVIFEGLPEPGVLASE